MKGMVVRWTWLGLVSVLISILLAGTAAAGELAASLPVRDITYIEFIIDASFSMRELVDRKQSRMDVAKEVMSEIIGSLEDRPDVQIALRVYGARNVECDDTVLVQDFGPVGRIRSAMLRVIQSLKPRGKTPIGLSLEQAALDFPDPRGRNVIVLITDGQESCGADPCAISRYLQLEGRILKPYVVGFGLPPAEEAKVKCIGNYYHAKDRSSLISALRSIIRDIAALSMLEVEVWSGGQNVTGITKLEVFEQSGRLAAVHAPAGKDVMRLSLEPGVYDLSAQLAMGPETIDVRSEVKLKPGETTRVRLTVTRVLP